MEGIDGQIQPSEWIQAKDMLMWTDIPNAGHHSPTLPPSVSQGRQQGYSPAVQFEVGMSLECWQTNKLIQLAKNSPSFMLKNKQGQQCWNETFGLSCVEHFCMLSSHRRRSDGPFSYTDQAIGWIRNSVLSTAFCLVGFLSGAMGPGDECWVGSPGCSELVKKGAWYHKALAWRWLGSSARCKFKPETRQDDVKNTASQNTSSYENALIFQHFVPSHNGNKY